MPLPRQILRRDAAVIRKHPLRAHGKSHIPAPPLIKHSCILPRCHLKNKGGAPPCSYICLRPGGRCPRRHHARPAPPTAWTATARCAPCRCPCQMQGGLLLLTASAGLCGNRTAQALLQECASPPLQRRRCPLPAPSTRPAPWPARCTVPGWSCGCTSGTSAAPGCWVLVNTAQPRGSFQDRLSPSAVPRLRPGAYRAGRPAPADGLSSPLTARAHTSPPPSSADCRMDITVFYSKELGVRYFTYRQGGAPASSCWMTATPCGASWPWARSWASPAAC